VDGTIKRIDTENHRYAAEIKLNGGAVTWFRAVQGSVGFIPGSFLIFPENVPNPSEAYRSGILMTAFKDQLWVALLRQRCLVRIDPALNRVVGKPIALAGIPLQLKATDHALWVSYASAEYMTRIEP
jgi:hypothetical protein